PGRANTKLPVEAGSALPAAGLLRTCVWVNSPRAALVPATKDLNWSRAPAEAVALRARVLAAIRAASESFSFIFFIDMFLVGWARCAHALRLHDACVRVGTGRPPYGRWVASAHDATTRRVLFRARRRHQNIAVAVRLH